MYVLMILLATFTQTIFPQELLPRIRALLERRYQNWFRFNTKCICILFAGTSICCSVSHVVYNFQSVQDSIMEQVKDSRWEDALNTARRELLDNQNDRFLLGYIAYAHCTHLIDKIPLKLATRIYMTENKSVFLEAWEKVTVNYQENSNTMLILSVLGYFANDKKAINYAVKAVDLDSLNKNAHYLNGITYETQKLYDMAIQSYENAISIDSTFYDPEVALINLYIVKRNYDSVFYYLRKIPFDDTLYLLLHFADALGALKYKDFEYAAVLVDKIERLCWEEQQFRMVEKLKQYIEKLSTNDMTEKDTLIVPLGTKFLGWHLVQPHDMIGLITVNGIEFIDCREDALFKEIKPERLMMPAPKYPEIGRKRGEEGVVILNILLEVDGSVVETKLMETNLPDYFVKAAQNAALKAVFTPARQYGKNVRVWVSFPICFRLR